MKTRTNDKPTHCPDPASDDVTTEAHAAPLTAADKVEALRGSPAVEADEVPPPPSGVTPLTDDERSGAITLVGEAEVGPLTEALDEVADQPDAIAADLGDMAPDTTNARAIAKRIRALRRARRRSEALRGVGAPPLMVALSDGHRCVNAVADELSHRASRGKATTGRYEATVAYRRLRNQSVAKGRSKAQRARNKADATPKPAASDKPATAPTQVASDKPAAATDGKG